MSRTELKAKLKDLIEALDDDRILDAVYDLLSSNDQGEEKDWWDDLTEGQKGRLKESISDFKEGRVLSHEEMKKNTQQWLSE